MEAALHAAKKAKHFQLENARWAEKIKQEKPGLKLDAENMLKYIQGKKRYNNINWELDRFNDPIVAQLCMYFTGDERCKLDPDKGLLIFGNVGCGKTTLMRLFNENQKSSFRIVPCKVIADKVLKAKNDADDVIREYSRLYSNSAHGLEFKNGDSLGICFDDLGTEDEVKNFGNTRNVMADLILRCYDNYQMKGRIHITTNLTRDKIKELYGDRVASRMQEMFNAIEFPVDSPDYRRQESNK